MGRGRDRLCAREREREREREDNYAETLCIGAATTSHTKSHISLKLGSTVFCVKCLLWGFGEDLGKGCPHK